MSGWIGVDLDGTLAHYGGWIDGSIGEPVPAMLERVKRWLAAGKDVRIVTARVGNRGAVATSSGTVTADVFCQQQTDLIQDWCEKHLGVRLPVTASKDFAMIELWDDRAVTVQMNTGEVLTKGY